jgi:hypothetical protein
MPSKPRKSIADLTRVMKSWLQYYDQGPNEFPTLIWRILASIPGGEEARNIGYEPFNIGWTEINRLARVLVDIQDRADKRDVEDLVTGLIDNDGEVARRTRVARERASGRDADAGFAVGVHDQGIIESNAEDAFREADPDEKQIQKASGFVDNGGAITKKGWDQINSDIAQIERNAMTWMRKTFKDARDEGHDSHGELVGTFWFEPTDPKQAYLVELAANSGRQERIDMVDLSFGDLASTAFDGVSDFGASVLGGQITFFDVKPEDMEVVEKALAELETASLSARRPRGIHERQRRSPRRR